MLKETIAAISTGMSNSGIGIVRMSGPEAILIADRVFMPHKGHAALADAKSHTVHYGNIALEGKIIDEALVLVMKAPNSYTREDVVEIDCHGGVYIMKKILNALIKSGARPAEPGEFTKRAFLNGRLDLAQAEAVIDVINSKNRHALNSSLKKLNGKLSEKIARIRSELLENIAYIEAALDDPEHISLDNYGDKLKIIVDNSVNNVEKLLKTVENGKLFTQGVKTVIIGKPNVGKSSILNILAGYDRAIVTDIAGTTRDTIEEQINLDGITLNLIDTAGIRETDDVIEGIGVERARTLASEADLILYVADSSTSLDGSDYDILEIIKERRTVVLLNKSDLEQATTADMLNKVTDAKVISVSAKDNAGFEELSDYVVELFANGELDFNDEIYITGERNKAALENALESLNQVRNSIEAGMPEDFYTVDLMNAYGELGKIIGESVEDDLVNEIFSKFCMGK
ncbi:MAG: tRNA uridine-5-carboxymethylaminomethyl(34) synthesis GTPase MnmE [Butyrivibrio sp.]|nr:tRNA uridine-5-carboxymethylaminomethyl(34) synthesis GTPase MnmE [Butyrivibrio sp.]